MSSAAESKSESKRGEGHDELYVATYYLQCLAHASYVVAHGGFAVVIDPRRDPDVYLADLESKGLRLKATLLTHIHADFVAGNSEITERANVAVMLGANAGASYPHLPVTEGDMVTLSEKYAIKALPTPGHTPGCVTWLLVDRTEGDRPLRAFTGDTLFVGNVGRPDLLGSVGFSADQMARTLFKTLHTKLMTLPDDVIVHPAHGAGSPCGKSLGSELSSTIGKEKATNEALQFKDETAFVEYITTGQPEAPQYFLPVVKMNKMGAGKVEEFVSAVPALEAEAFAAQRERRHMGAEEIVVLDTREADDYAAGHVVGSVNFPVGLNRGEKLESFEGNFAIWVGTLVSPSAVLLLVAPEGKEQESILRLARIGYHNVLGYLAGGMTAWKAAGLHIGHTTRHAIPDQAALAALVAKPGVQVLDVRTEGEFNCPRNGHIRGAINIPLNVLPSRLGELDKDKHYAVYCSGGYRSAIAASYLLQEGIGSGDLHGGYYNILAVARELTTGTPATSA
mmetsp:Transcript_13635/g.43548  ORF Transcript_13635/g.43548 Transcript_13635/m.43548 type:complete len:509 (+) Transcript_13635:40-1566(+)